MITQYHKPAPSYRSLERASFEQCEHKNMRLVVSVKTKGRQYSNECPACGVAIPIPASELTEWAKDTALSPVSVEERQRLQEKKYTRLKERQEELEDIARKRWWGWYNEYLRSDVWHEKRKRVFERAGNLCEACRVSPAKQVHHLTYDNVGREPLFDLVAVCVECHKQLDEK